MLQNGGGDNSISVDDMLVQASSLPLFADIGQFNILAETKSIMSAAEAEDYQIRLGDLLDKENIERIVFEQYLIEATPFREGYSTDEVSLTSENLFESAPDSLSCSKLFLVNTLDTKTDTTDLMVVTMIPDHTYLSEHNVSEITYLDKAEYSGIILYSDIDGSFREAGYFKKGRILVAEPLSPGDTSPEDGEIHFLTTYQNVGTKAIGGNGLLKRLLLVFALDDGGGYYNGGELDDAVCAASRTDSPGQPEQPEIKESPNIRTGGGGGGAAKTSVKPVTNEKQKYQVYLTVQKKSPNECCGTATGGGFYSAGSNVHCSATAKSGYTFDGWTGNMPGQGPWVDFRITNDVKATAMFCLFLEKSTKRPCWDYLTNIANPLNQMKVVPTNNGTLNEGIFSTYNPRRNSGKHQGIDLSAEVGTPIFAPLDGNIPHNKPFVTEQPQRTSGVWPTRYTGDKNGAGNRFYLDCTLPSGEKISYAFWHLQAGTPVAINPRTGMVFKPGDAVYQGDIIAYVGRTGNAYNVKNTHLHIGVKNSYGVWIDPEPYLNGIISKENGKVTKATFNKINCDNKALLDDSYYSSIFGMIK